VARQSVIPAVKERLELYLDDESPRVPRRPVGLSQTVAA